MITHPSYIRAGKALAPEVRAISGFTATARIEAAGAAGKPARITIRANTGRPMQIAGFDLPVVIDLAGVKLPKTVPIVLDHRLALSAMAGEGTPKIEGGAIMVEGVLARGVPEADRAIALAQAGVAIEASVGGPAPRLEFVEEGASVAVNGSNYDGPLYVAREFHLEETSLVVRGGDPDTRVGIAARRHSAHGGAANMDFEKWIRAMGLDPSKIDETQEGELRAAYSARHGGSGGGGVATMSGAVAQERQRVAAIEAACSGQWGDASDQVAYLRGQAVRGEISYAELMAGLKDSHELKALMDRRGVTNMIGLGARGSMHRSGVEPHEVIAGALLRLAGQEENGEKILGERAMQAGSDLRARCFMDIVAASLRLEGRSVPSDGSSLIRAGFTTISLPLAIESSVQRQLAERFKDHPRSWSRFAKVLTLSDFREKVIYRPSVNAGLIKVGRGGELKHGEIYEEETAKVQAETWGRLFRITRQMIMNDDMGVFTDLPTAMAHEAVRTVSDEIYKHLVSKVGTHFTSERKNYMDGVDTALSVESLTIAVKMMRMQTDAKSHLIDVTPSVLLVPPSLEATARQVVNSTEVGFSGDTPTGNPAHRIVEYIEVEPRLEANSQVYAGSGASAKAWYLFTGTHAEPLYIGAIDGALIPKVEMLGIESDPTTLGMTARAYLDFDVELGEYRSSFRSKGEA